MVFSNFPMTWIGPGIPGVRDCNAMYCETPLKDMPAVQVSEDLKWLEPIPPFIAARMKQFHPDTHSRQNYSKNAKFILAQAKELKLSLPKAFKELVQSEELQDRFPSVTACYFDLPEKIVPAPFGLGGHIIRFLNDQQICVLWYLYISAHGTPTVLAFYPVNGTDFLEDINIQDAHAVLEASESTRLVALTFAEFLYRYWIENCVWFKKYYKIDLTSTEVAYVQRA